MSNVPINLFTQFYLEPNDERFEELLYCIYKHQLGRYNKVTLLVENDATQLFCDRNFLEYRIVNIGKRANFNDFFRLMEQEENKHSYNVICNTDIFFPAPLQINHFYDNHRNYSPSKTVLALSRYDFHLDGTTTRFHRPDSQDAWIFYGNPSIRIELDYGMGIAGCDNRIAYDLQMQGFDLINPCTHIHAYHYHVSGVRNYLDSNNVPKQRIPPPYYLLNPF